MVKGISAADSIYSSAKGKIKKSAKKIAETIKDNQAEIVATGVGVAALGAYGAALYSLVKSDAEIIPINMTKQELDGDYTSIWQTIGDKIKEKFTIDLEHVPEGIDPTEKYFTDSDGNILISNVSNMPYPNPWYNPELAAEKLNNIQNAAENILPTKVSMADFLSHAGEKSSAVLDATEHLDVPFLGNDSIDIDFPEIDMPEVTTNTVGDVLSFLKEIVDNLDLG